MSDKSIVEYEVVKGRHPISGDITEVKIEKPIERTPEELEKHVRAELKKVGLKPIEKVQVKDPLTDEVKTLVVDRTGATEAKLILALADPDLTRDRKDFAVSMYLFERGKENTSFVVDLMRYKGAHTKETRVFKSQIRYDFDNFIRVFMTYLEDQVGIVGQALDLDIGEEEGKMMEYQEELQKRENERAKEERRPAKRIRIGYHEYAKNNGLVGDANSTMLPVTVAQVALAIHAKQEAKRMRGAVDAMTESREREKGKGIYLAADGRPYLQDDPFMDEAIEKDRAATKEIEHE